MKGENKATISKDVIVHRVTPSITLKRKDRGDFQHGNRILIGNYHSDKNGQPVGTIPSNKYVRNPTSSRTYNSNTTTTTTPPSSIINNNNNTSTSEAFFPKLDPNDEIQFNRIQQRRKQITMGKNTTGYECYLHQIPKEKRKPRCMDTPTTPNYEQDIPAKRWAGMVRAWRVALHKYDPEDLVSTQQQQPHDNSIVDETNYNNSMTTTPPSKRIREMELAESKGLLVDFGTTSNCTIRDRDTNNTTLTPSQQQMVEESSSSPFSVATQNSRRSLDFDQFDEQVDDDSDDDLL